MTVGFAESMPEVDNTEYHVEWLDSQQAFPSLSSTASQHFDDWQFLQRQEILQAQQEMAENKHRLETQETEDKWQQVDVYREKKFVEVAEQASDLPEKVPPAKPQRQQREQTVELTDEQQRLLYWEMIDSLQEEEACLEDLYYDRKASSTSSQRGRAKHLQRHIELIQRLHVRFEQSEDWNCSKIKEYLEHVARINAMDNLGNNSVPSSKPWGRAPSIDTRLLKGLVRLNLPRHLRVSASANSKLSKTEMEVDFSLQVKN